MTHNHKENILALIQNKNYFEAVDLLNNYNSQFSTNFTLYISTINNVKVKDYELNEHIDNILYFNGSTKDITLFHLLTKSTYHFLHILNQNILKQKLINLYVENIL